MKVFRYGIDKLTIGAAIGIAEGKIKGELNDVAKSNVLRGFSAIGEILKRDEAVYGVNTGFGVLCRTVISKEDTTRLQYNLLKSHACGIGKPVEPMVAKLMMIIKVHSLTLGYSGVSLDTIERIIWHIENDVIPVVPEKGSVGASGDLAPLAHLFLPLVGLGEVFYKGERKQALEVLKEHGLKPLRLHPKEGLALINGTQFISAFATFGAYRFARYLDAADIISAVSIEATKSSIKPFDYRLHDLRPYDGCRYVANRVRLLLEDSEIVRSHANCNKVQDPYSFRCIPQVHGAAREAFLQLKRTLDVELNSVTDNPVIIDKDTVISGGNFHGEPVALPLDYATLAASELGNISDRRVYLLLSGDDDVPKMLLRDVGINSGFMISQYLTAALASENKSLSFPASADSIPTSLGQEDHVSMGSIAARKFNAVLDNLSYILAVELLLSAQALEFRRPLRSTPLVEYVHDVVRERVSFAEEDRIFSEDINKVHRLIEDGAFIEQVNNSLKVDNSFKEKFSVY
ncbi:histidine ammonia-lyase [Hippea maritima]|uniref:Histidine ammonia-lyase n=1 Tax=Hippea maritima (strain ATCC 700847 / DSM 10411 / MH2) TaxID=760142 RepID=F2LUI7_HIPMA|nr:histidine ammonia-lyase [Hippea maritima]AEA34577.1 histidine ammonia-lyase [Hippea maritima DSM 10411]